MKALKHQIHDFQDYMSTLILKTIVGILFKIQSYFYKATNINYPEKPCIFALWHAHQCGVYSFFNKEKINVMISRSSDGDIIAYATELLGIKTVRGSKTRGGMKASLELIDRLKNGEYGAITIDGPKGPKRIVKKGIIEIARITGVPIVPMSWYSADFGFLKFNTWDEFRFPMLWIRMINLYGEPIYVPFDASEDEIEFYRKKVEDELNSLYNRAKSEFKELIKAHPPQYCRKTSRPAD